MTRMVIDVAGAPSGGAARFRSELRAYREDGRATGDLEVIGGDHRISPKWLVRREFVAMGARRRIAANNISFVLPGGDITVLLRNPLHFLRPGEEQDIPGVPADLPRQSALVRHTVGRASRVVTPSPGMRTRVLEVMPQLEDRLIARFHPLTIPDLSATASTPAAAGTRYALMTGLPSVHKDLLTPARRIVSVLRRHAPDVRLAMTCNPVELGWNDDQILFLGQLGLNDILAHTRDCEFAFLPTTVESFGYPLAEARSLGVPIVVPTALDTAEVAGPAAVTYEASSDDSLAEAVLRALGSVIAPDNTPFDRDSYFDWLIGASR